MESTDSKSKRATRHDGVYEDIVTYAQQLGKYETKQTNYLPPTTSPHRLRFVHSAACFRIYAAMKSVNALQNGTDCAHLLFDIRSHLRRQFYVIVPLDDNLQPVIDPREVGVSYPTLYTIGQFSRLSNLSVT